jgi:hypothetical protein
MMLLIYNVYHFFLHKFHLGFFAVKVIISSLIGFNLSTAFLSLFFIILECFSLSTSLFFMQPLRLALLMIFMLTSNIYFLVFKKKDIQVIQHNTPKLELDLKQKYLLLGYLIVTVIFPILINFYANHR